MTAPPTDQLRFTLYYDVISSWCFWLLPTLDALLEEFEDEIDFQWKLAPVPAADLPANLDECRRFYQRSGTLMRAPFMLNSGWYDPEVENNYRAANLVAEAARQLGATDLGLARTLAEAAMIEGQRVGDLATAVAIAAEASDLCADALQTKAQAPETEAAIAASEAAFTALGLTQRPAIVLDSPIGDRVAFSGIVQHAPLHATIASMLEDIADYASFQAHFGVPTAPYK